MKVLIIEDERAMSDLIALKFQVEGFEVVQAFSLAEAKQKVAASFFEAILTDYLLPDGEGLEEFLTTLKGNPAWQKVPVVIMTNYIEDVNVSRLKSLGVADVLVKYQVVPAQMVAKVKQLIGGTNG